MEIIDYKIERLSYATEVFDKLTIRRKPDQYSSKIGMMAYLNKRDGKLSWGFTEMTLRVDELSVYGTAISQKEFNFRGGGVGNSSVEDNLEVVTLLSTMVGQECAGKC